MLKPGRCFTSRWKGSNPAQDRHLDNHWNGARLDFYREVGRGDVYRIDEDGP